MHLDKNGSPITTNTCRAPPLDEVLEPPSFEDFVIQQNFDFGA